LAVRHIREHITKVIDTSLDLDNALSAALDDQRDAVLDALKTLYMDERAADNMEVTLFEELSKGELDPKQRETLMRFVRRIDDVTEHLQQAGLNLELLMESKKIVPREYWALYKGISKILVEETKALRAAVEAFGRDEEEVLKHREEVKRLEQEIDDSYFQLRKKLIRSPSDPMALVILTDLLGAIENASDNAKDAADMLFILVMANR